MGIMDWKHWIVILVVVVLVFGTKKLKGLGTDVGETIKGFRTAMRDDTPIPQNDSIHGLPKSPVASSANLGTAVPSESTIRAATE
ncbi:twin-arginine translocase TatA/TatE family subunit [Pseudomonas japonica]|uniref:twin-arginine translocase TatA/TatE family subunit n=1 Tax=Pseudomonas japonica TaxID=256466 RepID=UPI0015E2AD9B|nr:twin-arginine translocase TatA/TatE family subunit [Pseudomonas japonica]